MRFRDILARIAFLGVSATQAGCCCPGDETLGEGTVDIPDPTIEVAALIARCEANPDDCAALCSVALEQLAGPGQLFTECAVTELGNGARVHLVYHDGAACGRVPAGLTSSGQTTGAGAVVGWLVRAAHLEAASVVAFVHLAADLARLGAPRALIHGALAAAQDEVRHAAMLRALVGRDVPLARVVAYRPASLGALAMLNAVEGCVRETVGAAVNLWQARHATDPAIRSVFERIAGDEANHAALSWRIHEWASPQLSAVETAEIEAARASAMRTLLDGDALTIRAHHMRRILGLPSRDELAAITAAIGLRTS